MNWPTDTDIERERIRREEAIGDDVSGTIDTPHWDKLPPLDEPMDAESLECLLVNTGAYHDDDMIADFANMRRTFQTGVHPGWMVLPVMLLTAIRRAVREIKRQRERISELEAGLSNAIDGWESGSHYKSDYLREKHGDDEGIEAAKKILGIMS